MPNRDRHAAMLTLTHRVRPSGRLWNPPADVYRGAEGWIVKVDLAGICTDELEIEIDSATLRIRGCRRDTLMREGFSYQQMEITYSRFEKSLQFPGVIDGTSLTHEYKDGFLIIKFRSR